MTEYAKASELGEQAREKEWTRPSFGKQLFLGDFRLDLVHPAPALPEEADQAGRGVRLGRCGGSWTTHVDPAADRADRAGARRGGQGAGRARRVRHHDRARSTAGWACRYLDYCRALMLVGSYCPALATLLSAHQSIGVPQPLKQFGTEEQKREFLPRCARGEVSAFLLTEPDVGSDPARLSHHRGQGRRRLRAQRREAVDDQRRGRRPAGGHGPDRAGDQRVRRRGRLARHHGRSGATRSWACAASRTA